MPAYYRRGLQWLRDAYIPASTGGWNPDANIWELPDNQAFVLDNWLIRPGKLVARGPLINISKFDAAGTQIPVGFAFGDALFGSTSPSGVLNIWYKLDNATGYIDPWNAPLLNAPAANLASSGIAQHQVSLDNGLLGFNASPLTHDVSGGPRWINFNGLMYGISYDSTGAVATDVNVTYHMKPLNLLTMPVLQTPDSASYITPVATAGSDNAAIGTTAWTNPNNIILNDPFNPATVSLSGVNTSHYVQATFGVHTVPAGAIIQGVQVFVTYRSDNGLIQDNSVRILKGGSVVGTNHADTLGNMWPNSITGFITKSYGGPFDLWGLGLTPADVNAANFGAVVGVKTLGTDIAYIININIQVWYTIDNAPVPTVLASAPHGAFDLKGYLSRVWLLGGIDTPGGLASHEPTTLFYTNPIGTPGAGTPLGSATVDWKDPVTAQGNKLTMDANGADYGVGLAQSPNALMIFRHASVWRLTCTTSTSFVLRAISHEVGCVDARSIVETDKGVFFLSERGLMFTDGTIIKNVSGSVFNQLTTALQQALGILQRGATKSGFYPTSGLTSQGHILITVGSMSAVDAFSPTFFSTNFSGMYDPSSGAWSRLTSSIWPTERLPVLLVGRPNRQQLYSVGGSNTTLHQVVQFENFAYADANNYGTSFLLHNNVQNSLEDFDKTSLFNFTTYTNISIPLVWMTKAIPFDVSHKQGLLKRYFMDFTFSTSKLPINGLLLQPVPVLSTAPQIDAVQTVQRRGNDIAMPVVGGGPVRFPDPLVARFSREVQAEVSDLYFTLQNSTHYLPSSIDISPATGMGPAVLEVMGIGIEFATTRNYEGANS